MMLSRATSLILLLSTTLLISCHQNISPDSTIAKVKEKLQLARHISYDYKSVTDNRFNDTQFKDSAEVNFFRIPKSHHGFGLHVTADHEEYIYNGLDFRKYKHKTKEIVTFKSKEIESDSSYFTRFSFFATNPLNLLELNKPDSILDAHKHVIIKYETENESKSDSSKIVEYQTIYFIQKGTHEIDRIVNRIIRERDTLQVVNHYFNHYAFSDKEYIVGDSVRSLKLQYKTLTEDEEYEPFTYTPIKEGTYLTQKAYKNIYGDTLEIFGESEKISFIMFSFIGCTACERALKDFRDIQFNFDENINAFYSSFQNTSSSLKKYLKKEAIPFIAFGKESNMIDDFSLYFSPSFVFIDPNGKVFKVIEGYDNEVKDTLFEILLPK